MEKKKCSLYKHGMSDTKLFRIWCDMRKRCRDKNVQHYDRYGGRGIKVCDEWNGEFMPFYEWAMKNGVSIMVVHMPYRKKPCLAIKIEGENAMYKVASFNSEETAHWFLEMFEEFIENGRDK